MGTHAECGNRLCGDCYSDGWDAGEKRIADLEQKLADASASFKAACAEITILETEDPYRRIDQLENSLSELVNQDAPAETVELRTKVSELEQKLTDLGTDTLAAAQRFIDAYPESVFPPIPKELWPQIATALKQIGVSIDRVSASNMKHVGNCIRDDINAAIQRSKS